MTRVETGRIRDRSHRPSMCQGCGQRVMIGTPRPSSTWPARLTLSREQYDLLLIAAAEYAQLSDEAGEYEGAVPFVDWLGPDVLRPAGHHEPLEADGAPARNMSGGLANRSDMGAHRHPFPLPTTDWRPGRREGSG